MHSNFIFPSVTEALPRLLTSIVEDGLEVGSRAGRTQELTHIGITLTDPCDREILCAYRKPSIAAQIAETMWVLSGRDDIDWLEHYLPRARDFSDDGETWRAGYGKRLRAWEDHAHAKVIDQWRFVIEHLLEQPASRRAVMSIWDPAIDTEDGKDIPCNDWLSFLSRDGYLDLHVALRSNDVIWGWSGINQFEWSTLLEITAGMLGMKVGSLHFSTTSFHLYDHHFAKAEQIRNQTFINLDHLQPSPRFDASGLRDMEDLDDLLKHWFQIEYDIRTGSPLVQHYVDTFPEPMLRSWLRVLQWWWSKGDRSYLATLKGTRLEAAALTYSVQPKREDREVEQIVDGTGSVVREILVSARQPSDFINQLCDLHLEKEQAYGGSWKKRGELFSILPNVGRKVDRIQGGETSDETSADTAEDLFVYLAKYKTWLDEHLGGEPLWAGISDQAFNANEVMQTVERQEPWPPRVEDLDMWKDDLDRSFDEVLVLAEAKDPRRADIVNEMLPISYRLARTLWEREVNGEYRGADVD